MRSFGSLQVWEKAHKLILEVYAFSKQSPPVQVRRMLLSLTQKGRAANRRLMTDR
jgi:hypothetical protein